LSRRRSLVGADRPRLEWIAPGGKDEFGQDAIDLAGMAGLLLDDWQAYVLRQSMRERERGKWAAFEVALIVSRQNGKGSFLEARELAGLFLVPDENLILHSAHEFKTTSEHFRRILSLIQSSRDLDREVARVRTQTGAESIELRNGKRLRFVARSSGSGRGFSGDLIVLDEAQRLGDDAMAALLPTLSARPNPQVVYTASAGNELSVQLGRVRKRALAGGDKSLTFFEWSAGKDDDPADPATWAVANPALGIRISQEHVSNERAALSPDAFAQERLGIGKYPADDEGWQVISEDVWQGRLVEAPEARRRPFVFAVDASPLQKSACLSVASWLPDGAVLVEVPEGDHRPGTSWVVPRMVELQRKWRPAGWVVDPRGPAAGLIADAERAGLEVVKPSPGEAAAAFAQFRSGVLEADGLIRHLGQDVFASALKGATVRDIGDGGELWARRDTSVDISPLVAATLAQWYLRKHGRAYDPLRSVAPPT